MNFNKTFKTRTDLEDIKNTIHHFHEVAKHFKKLQLDLLYNYQCIEPELSTLANRFFEHPQWEEISMWLGSLEGIVFTSVKFSDLLAKKLPELNSFESLTLKDFTDHIEFIYKSIPAIIYKQADDLIKIEKIINIDFKEPQRITEIINISKNLSYFIQALEADIENIKHSERFQIETKSRKPLPTNELNFNTFCKKGNIWEITFNGKEISLKDSQGLERIHRLLVHQGNEIAAVLLLKINNHDEKVEIISNDFVLDDKAISSIKDKRNNLLEEAKEAEANNDLYLKEKIIEEVEKIDEQLRSTIGLGGKKRGFNSAHEQARKAVTNSIVRAIKGIQKTDSLLSQHLVNSIKMGMLCCYKPEKPISWKLFP